MVIAEQPSLLVRTLSEACLLIVFSVRVRACVRAYLLCEAH